MLFFIKKTIAALVMPLPLAFLLCVTGGLLLLARRRRTGGLLVGAALLGIFLASWGPVADRLLASLEGRHPPVLSASTHAGVVAVVVLGSGYHPNPDLPITAQLGDSALIRLSEGLRLHRQLPGARLVLTGGSAFGNGAVARGYAEAAVALGTPVQALVVLDTPRDTDEEAWAVRELLGQDQPFLLVTSASHMPRSVLHFRRAGLQPIPAPTGHKSLPVTRHQLDYWVPSAAHLRKTERAIYEYLGALAMGLDLR